MKSKAKALYVHIPFCRNICTYCDFKKFIYNQARVDGYFKSLFLELKQYKEKKYKSIYVGGGTPSCIDDKNLNEMLHNLSKLLDKNYKEFCIECNVEDINEKFLQTLTFYGINRVSIGVQSFNDKYINFCGRKHTKEQAITNIKLAGEYINNVSIDLIFAFPFQTIKDIDEEIKILEYLPIKHLSYYSLLIEKNTILHAKKYENVDDGLQAQMYELICNKLKNIGFKRYEISNFAKEKKYESYHNKVYWKNEHYDAAGIAASGYFDNVRYVNNSNIIEYINLNHKKDSEIILSTEDVMFEEIMLALRMDKGLNIDKFNKKFNVDFVSKYKKALNFNLENDLLVYKNNIIKTTFKGSLLLNSVLEKFMY